MSLKTFICVKLTLYGVWTIGPFSPIMVKMKENNSPNVTASVWKHGVNTYSDLHNYIYVFESVTAEIL